MLEKECDDGNTFSGDGCSSGCVVETGWGCTAEPSQCTGENNEIPSTCEECVGVGSEWCDMPEGTEDECLGACSFGTENIITTLEGCSLLECDPICENPYVCHYGVCVECGDGICDFDETCTTCVVDCGACVEDESSNTCDSGIYSYPQDLDIPSNNIFHYTSWDTDYKYAEGYCSIVRGCAGYKDVTTTIDGTEVCRCDAGSFGCTGDSCATSGSSVFVTITSVTCVECDEDVDCEEDSICQNNICVKEDIKEIVPTTENKKDMSRYFDKEVFLISDKDWKSVLPLISLTTWTGSEDCKKGYGTPENVCVYPTLIFHEEVGERFVDLATGAELTASSSDGAPVSNVLDKNTGTSWNSGSSEQGYLKLDLHETKQFNRIELFEQYEPYYIDIYVATNDFPTESIDDIDLPNRLEYQILVENYILEVGLNVFEFDTINARYIKFVLRDNPVQSKYPNWKGIAEINIYGGEKFNYESFDADSIIYFMQQYNAEKVMIIGETPQELNNLLITGLKLGAGLNKKDIRRIAISNGKNYFSYWKNFSDIVYVEENYELAIMASTYASLINAPLIIKGTNLDKDENFEEKNIICVGNVDKNCNEQYTLVQLQQKYVEETNTDKIILINSNDLNIKAEEEFQPEKSGTSFYELYSKTSLASPILASAKHELIISTIATDYESIDEFIENKINSLQLSPEYLTIIASPDAIQLSQSGRKISSNRQFEEELDNSIYGNINEDLFIELMVGRIFGITTSDVSSLISRNIFYSSFPLQNNFAMLNGGGPHGTHWIMRGKTNDYLLSNAGLNMRSQYIRETQNFNLDNLEQQKIIAYIDHGSPSGGNYGGLRTTSLREKNIYFPSTLFVGDSCSTCAYSKAKAPLFCTNVLRRGAVAYFGSVDVMYISGDPQSRVIDFLLGTTIGEANRRYKNYQIMEAYNRGERDLSRPDILVGDPTLNLGVDRPTNIDLIKYKYNKNEKKLEINIPFLDESFQNYFVTLGGKSLYKPFRFFIGCSNYEVRFYCEESWTNWTSINNPWESGDFERLTSHRWNSPSICESPTDIGCRMVDSEVPWYETGEVVTCDLEIGLTCRNVNNLEEEGDLIFLDDYVIEFLDDANLNLTSIKINNENYVVSMVFPCAIDVPECVKYFFDKGRFGTVTIIKSGEKNYAFFEISLSNDYDFSEPLDQLNIELIMEEVE